PTIKHHGEERGTNKERLERDLVKIMSILDEEPLNHRAIFNLAKCLEGLGNDEWALEAFKLRSEMGGWPEEAWYAKFRLGCLTCLDHFEEGSEILLEAWRDRPWRIEPLRALASFASQVADQAPYPEEEQIFVHRNHYRTQED